MDTVGVYENRKVVIESEGNRIRAEDFRHEALVVGATELQGWPSVWVVCRQRLL